MRNSRPVALWLFACCGMVFVAAVLGAITRLTGSGLSITDWAPIIGALPPLDAAAWEKAFKGYQAIPQYQILNRGMTLEEFKNIYFWEWLHRFWDRLIGIVFLLPFVWFLVKKRIDRRTGLGLAAIFALGGLQGFVGWFMVESGLAVRTSVSPYRLALHLGFALLIYALMLWMGLGMWGDKGNPSPAKSKGLLKQAQDFASSPARGEEGRLQGWLTLVLLVVTMVWGAFTAGLHAGEAYNTWPLMGDHIFPDAAFTMQPEWINAFENLALVQFIHRWLGPVTMAAILAWVWRRYDAESDMCWNLALGIMAVLQVALGLATLLSHAEIVIATLHQAGAIMLLTLMLVNLQNLTNNRQ